MRIQDEQRASPASAAPFPFILPESSASVDEQLYPAVPIRGEGFVGGSPSLGPDLDPLLQDTPLSSASPLVLPGRGPAPRSSPESPSQNP